MSEACGLGCKRSRLPDPTTGSRREHPFSGSRVASLGGRRWANDSKASVKPLAARRLDALDGLRGVAAMTVVVYHILGNSDWFAAGMYDFASDGILGGVIVLSPLRILFDGRAAVMTFFVLSGFVLSRGFWAGRPLGVGGYLARRVVRLYPPVVMSAVFALGLLGLGQAITHTGNGLVDLGAIGTSFPTLLNNMGLLGLTESPLNVVWWSLRWEMWFSLGLPVIFIGLACLGCGPRRRFRWMPVALGVACLVVSSLQPWGRANLGISGAATRAQLYMPMFGIGMAIAAFEGELGRAAWLRRPKAVATAACAAILVWGLRGPLGALGAAGLLPASLAQGLAIAFPLIGIAGIIALAVGAPAVGGVLGWRPLVWVGERSYSLYLVHWPIVAFLVGVTDVVGSPIWFVLACCVASAVAMIAFYRWVEVPAIRMSAGIGRRSPKPASGDDPPVAPERAVAGASAGG